jgi:hypothetical protein
MTLLRGLSAGSGAVQVLRAAAIAASWAPYSRSVARRSSGSKYLR